PVKASSDWVSWVFGWLTGGESAVGWKSLRAEARRYSRRENCPRVPPLPRERLAPASAIYISRDLGPKRKPGQVALAACRADGGRNGLGRLGSQQGGLFVPRCAGGNDCLQE